MLTRTIKLSVVNCVNPSASLLVYYQVGVGFHIY